MGMATRVHHNIWLKGPIMAWENCGKRSKITPKAKGMDLLPGLSWVQV